MDKQQQANRKYPILLPSETPLVFSISHISPSRRKGIHLAKQIHSALNLPWEWVMNEDVDYTQENLEYTMNASKWNIYSYDDAIEDIHILEDNGIEGIGWKTDGNPFIGSTLHFLGAWFYGERNFVGTDLKVFHALLYQVANEISVCSQKSSFQYKHLVEYFNHHYGEVKKKVDDLTMSVLEKMEAMIEKSGADPMSEEEMLTATSKRVLRLVQEFTAFKNYLRERKMTYLENLTIAEGMVTGGDYACVGHFTTLFKYDNYHKVLSTDLNGSFENNEFEYVSTIQGYLVNGQAVHIEPLKAMHQMDTLIFTINKYYAIKRIKRISLKGYLRRS